MLKYTKKDVRDGSIAAAVGATISIVAVVILVRIYGG